MKIKLKGTKPPQIHKLLNKTPGSNHYVSQLYTAVFKIII